MNINEHHGAGIQRTMKNDAKLNAWFEASDRKLFRLTDLQWNECKKRGNEVTLIEQLERCVSGVNIFDHAPEYPGVHQKVVRKT